MTKAQNSSRSLSGWIIFASIVAIAVYLQFGSKESAPESKTNVVDTVENTAESPTVKTEPTTKSSTVVTKSDEVPAEPVIAPEDQKPSEVEKTADPNDEPDNALAGITYQDVQMWELEKYQLPAKVKGGVLISKIHAKSSFAESQIRPGDIVTHAHHSDVVNFTDLENAVKGRTHSLLDVYRDGKPFQVVLNKPFRPASK